MDVLQRNARTESYRVQGVLSDLEVKTEALGEALVETTQEGTTTGEDDTIGDDVGVELGRRSLERAEDSALDLADRVVEALGDLAIVDLYLAGHGIHHIRTPDGEVYGSFVEVSIDGTYLDLDLLSGTFPDLDLVLLAHVIHDVLRQLVASGVDGLILDDTTERDDSDLRRTTTDVHDKFYKGAWNGHTIISIAIGQGEVLATPLQIANLAALIANRGYYIRPHVVHSIGGMPLDSMYRNHQPTGISRENWEYIVAGMAGAVTGGTCRAANFAPGEIEVCGKTGTAENPHGKDHSAFIGFAPRSKPRIAVSVYVENGGFGAQFGVPIGRVMMEYYLRDGKLSGSGEAIASSMEHRSISYLNDI